MLNGPFSPWPDYSEQEKSAVLEVISSNKVNYWTGTKSREFEAAFAEFSGCRHAVAVANGTLALDLALRALDLPQGTEVIVTPRTFIASISSIVNAGLKPVFADIDRDTQNISPDTIRQRINENTSAIMCVHLAGWPCDMTGIADLAKRHDLRVIEDCAQAHGAKIDGKSVGSFGDVAAWSFCQDKIMTTIGEGGMVTTNSTELWEKMWAYKDHGKSWKAVYEKQHPPGFRWLHESFGTNWRITEVQSAVGLLQLEKMAQWQETREHYTRQVLDCANGLDGLRVAYWPEYITHACYKCYVFVEPEKLADGWSRDRIMEAINEMGVPCFSGSCSEVYQEKAFTDSNLQPPQALPTARELGHTSLMFLVHPTLTKEEIALTCDVITRVMHKATGKCL